MEKQLAATLAILLFCALYTTAIAAQTKSQAVFASPEKTRAEVKKFGFGKRVKVQLQNGANVRGRITGLSDDQFVVTDATGATTKVAYSAVARISKQRELPRFLQGAFTGIAYTAAVVGTLVVLALAFHD
jgi:sRNA-binding regulator protein Hfq